MSNRPQTNFTNIISMIGAVFIGALLTAHYYQDESGPIESLKERLRLSAYLLTFSVVLDLVLLGVILYGW